MNLIVLLFFSSIYFEGNSQLVRRRRFLPKQQGDISNVEPYEIQTIKRTMSGEKQTKLKSQETLNIQNTEKLPQISVQDNPRHKITYKKNKNHMLDKPTIHIDTENAIIDYEKNDTIATQRQLVEIESMIIKHSTDETNVLDFSLNDEDHNDNDSFENVNNTRRLISGLQNVQIPRYDFDLPHANIHSFPNNSSIELKNEDSSRDPLIPKDDTDEKDYNNERMALSSSSPLNDLNNNLEEDTCIDTGDIETPEKTDSEAFDENLRRNIPTSGRGISDFVKSRMMLFNHPRVCYACNSLRDRSCWSPNRRTSVKYCRKDQTFCLVKVYEQEGNPQVIRDCGDSCSSFSTAVIGEAYASCTVCNSDLCNSAGGPAMQNFVFIVIVAISIRLGVSNTNI